jgi:tRNA A37 threonylcarbamoyladenosine synthetase subunit TsaC/SUA5/YrdC
LSQNKTKLNKIKNRPLTQPVLREVDGLETLKNFVRVPKKHRQRIRRAKKTTFIFPSGESFRVVKNERHLEFLKKFKWMYSTSANPHGRRFDEVWARERADIVVENKKGLFEGEPSRIYRISKNRIKKIR